MEEELTALANRINLQDLSESLNFPKYFEVETIRACNARCSMCTVHEWKDKNNKMEEQLFDKIAEEMSHYSEWINHVCLSRNGEPLLDANLVKKIKLLKKYGIKHVTFSTNASILSEKKAIELIESGLDDIRFSIDGITKETFESIRKGLNFEQVIKNCLKFIELRGSSTKPRIQVRMTLQDSNKHEEEDFQKFWKSKLTQNDIVSSKPMHSWGNQLESYKKNGLDVETSIPCISPWSTMVIHFGGTVPLCGCDYNNKFALGDANKNTIKEIWQGEEYKKIRQIHSTEGRNKIPLCIGCNVWDDERKKIYNKK